MRIITQKINVPVVRRRSYLHFAEMLLKKNLQYPHQAEAANIQS